jgi:hypothetical protein
MLGEVTLTMKLAGSSDMIDVDFVVVEALVAPELLGKSWIDRYIWSIDPPKKSVLIQFDEAKEPYRSQLTSSPVRLSHPIRVSHDQTLPPFSETWVKCNSRSKGFSLLRPSHRRDRMVQVKNGVKSLLNERNSFCCLVANFSDHPSTLSSLQVIGEAESVSAWPEGKLEKQLRQEMCPSEEWEADIRDSVPHLTEVQKYKLFETLKPHAYMWNGKLGRISAVKNHILTSGPPVASQLYIRAGPQSRTLIDAEVDRMLQMDVI